MVKKRLEYVYIWLKRTKSFSKLAPLEGASGQSARNKISCKKIALFLIMVKSREYLSQKLTGSNKKSSGNSWNFRVEKIVQSGRWRCAKILTLERLYYQLRENLKITKYRLPDSRLKFSGEIIFARIQPSLSKSGTRHLRYSPFQNYPSVAHFWYAS